MTSIGEILRELRTKKGDPLRKVAAYLDIDQAILSKIETDKRKATKAQISSLAKYYATDKDKLMVAWLSDRVLYEVQDEEFGEAALKAAEEKVAYLKLKKTSRSVLIKKMAGFFKEDGRIKKAWLFGSFCRGDQNLESDVDLMVEERPDKKFNYFDLADIQYKLEKILKRKVDIGFATTLRESIANEVVNEKQLIYEN